MAVSTDLNFLPSSNFHLKIMLFKQRSIKFKGTSENSCMPVSDYISWPSSASQNQRSNPSISSLVSGDLTKWMSLYLHLFVVERRLFSDSYSTNGI